MMRLEEELRYTEEKVTRLELLVNHLVSALKEISDIEDRYNCGDWDEIEEARKIALEALEGAK